MNDIHHFKGKTILVSDVTLFDLTKVKGFHTSKDGHDHPLAGGFLIRMDTRSRGCIFRDGFLCKEPLRIADDEKREEAVCWLSGANPRYPGVTFGYGVSTSYSIGSSFMYGGPRNSFYLIDHRDRLGYLLPNPRPIGDPVTDKYYEVNCFAIPNSRIIGSLNDESPHVYTLPDTFFYRMMIFKLTLNKYYEGNFSSVLHLLAAATVEKV